MSYNVEQISVINKHVVKAVFCYLFDVAVKVTSSNPTGILLLEASRRQEQCPNV